jgi:hypothetical protein
MSEVVQLLPEPDPERDAAIFKDWRTGKKSIVALARDYDLPQSHITHILDQHLPQLTPQAQFRELRKLLHDLEELRCAYHAVATKENDPEAANVAVRTAHEIAQLRQFVGGSAHNDPIQLQQVADPQRKSSPLRMHLKLAQIAHDGKIPPEEEAEIRSFYP